MLESKIIIALEKIVEKGVTASGQQFIDLLCSEIAEAVDADIVFVAELVLPEQGTARTLSRYMDGKLVENTSYNLDNTPCADVVGKTACSYTDNVTETFPNERFLVEQNIEGYLGVPLFDTEGQPIGHVVALYRKPIPDERLSRVIIQLFTGRLANELERRRLSEQLSKSDSLYQSIINQMADYLVVFVSGGQVQLVNQSLKQATLFKEAIDGNSFYSLFDTEQAQQIQLQVDALKPEKDSFNIEQKITTDDDTVWILWHIKAIFDEQGDVYYYQSIGRDLTEVKRSEEERHNMEFMLNHAEKMSAIGKLAGGVAHDFNNQLTSIKGYAELLVTTINDDSKISGYAQNIYKSAVRSADITQQLLAFSRREEPVTNIFNIHDIVNEVITLVSHSMDKRISLELELDANNPKVCVNSSLLQNALMNLVLNARDAIEGSGIIKIKTSDIAHNDNRLIKHGINIESGTQVLLSVMDDGCGIDEDIKRRVFEPFFTTKEVGKGSGIGLAAVYNTITNHDGFIWLDSVVGEGTIMNIILPSVSKDNDNQSGNGVTEETQLDKPNHKILVVDDEPMVLEVSTLMLESLGHDVIGCESPEKAMAVFLEHDGDFDLVIIDMRMPSMTGKELFIKLKAHKPEIRAVISSGFQMNEKNDDLLALGIKGFINKPFSMKHLTESLSVFLAS